MDDTAAAAATKHGATGPGMRIDWPDGGRTA